METSFTLQPDGQLKTGPAIATSVRMGANGTTTTTHEVVSSKKSTQAANYECVTNRSTKDLDLYAPVYTTYDKDWVFSQYAHHPTVLNNARTLAGGQVKKQIEICTTGGSKTLKWWKRLKNSVASASADDSRTVLIGQKWGTAVRDGQVASSLAFKVGGGVAPIEVSGSIPVSGGGKWGGSIGPDTNLGIIGNKRNQVNADWFCGTLSSGSKDFKGNVGHGLWEFDQNEPRDQNFSLKSFVDYRV